LPRTDPNDSSNPQGRLRDSFFIEHRKKSFPIFTEAVSWLYIHKRSDSVAPEPIYWSVPEKSKLSVVFERHSCFATFNDMRVLPLYAA
jgi:hypothetical protein